MSTVYMVTPELDPDPDMRAVVQMVNDHGFRTSSSCQGHPDRPKTGPHITVVNCEYGSLDFFETAPHFDHTTILQAPPISGRVLPTLHVVCFKDSIIGHWADLVAYLTEKLGTKRST